MRELTEDEEAIAEDIMYRAREELKGSNLRITTLIIKAEDEEVVSKTERVKEFMEETIEETENERDVIATVDLWEKYDDWNRAKGNGLRTYMSTVREMGMYLGNYGLTKKTIKIGTKTRKGYKKIRYKVSEVRQVKEFLDKYTEKEDSPEYRISLRKLTKVYRIETGDKIGETEFNERAKKYGYRQKAAIEVPYYVSKETGKKIKRTGKEKIEKCLMNLKWKENIKEKVNVDPELKESLNLEMYPERKKSS
jgi:hypothetical protein